MTFGPINTESPFLPITFDFPSLNPEEMAERLPKIYTDISSRLNTREISYYPLNEIQNGQSWFTEGNPQTFRGAFRQVFTFSSTGNIAHNISNITQVNGYGQFTDGTNFYGAIYGSNTSIAGQISFYVTSTNIVILSGVGAPSISSGIIVLDYLKN